MSDSDSGSSENDDCQRDRNMAAQHEMNPLFRDFLNAAIDDDRHEIILYMKDGCDVDEMVESEEFASYSDGPVCALLLAAINHNSGIVKLLIEHGADMSKVTQYYTRAVIHASHKNLSDRLQALSLKGLYYCDYYKQCNADFISTIESGDFIEIDNLILKSDNQILNDKANGNNNLSFLILSKCPSKSVGLLLDKGININGTDSRGLTPLISAVLAGNIELVNDLIQRGADVNKGEDVGEVADLICPWVKDELHFVENLSNDRILNSDEKSPLIYAIWTGRSDIVKCLLDLKADSNKRDSQSKTPLSHALCAGLMDVIDLLISHGADVNSYNFDTRESILFDAVHLGSGEIVKSLLDAGANANHEDRVGKTPLLLAAEIDKAHLIEIFLNVCKVDINSSDKSKITALMYAAKNSNHECVQFLLNAGASFEMADENGHTAADIAATVSDLKCLKIFMESVSDSSLSNFTDKMLHSASSNSNSELLEFCLRSCKNVNLLNSFSQTPLMCAAEEGRTESIKLLLQHGADVNLKHENGCSAVMEALEIENLPCFSLLMKAGADVDYVPHSFDTLLNVAAEKENTDFLKLLLEKSSKLINTVSVHGATPLTSALMRKNEEAVDLVLNHGADVNICSKNGKSPLMYAVEENLPKYVRLLLKAGAKVDVTCNYETVLMSALRKWECLEILLKDGSLFDINRKLKSVHTEDGIYLGFKWDIKCLMLLFEYDVFEWEWFVYGEQFDQLGKISFAIVSVGNSPCMFKNDNGQMTSLLQEAFLGNDYLTARYLLANLFFTVEDYKTITTDQGFQQKVREAEAVDTNTISLLDQVTSQPWSLETLSFLSLSSSLLSRNQFGQKRSEQIDSLNLPELFKSVLKFRKPLHKLCSSQWKFIGINRDGKEENLLIPSKAIYPCEQDVTECETEDCENCQNLGASIDNM